MRELLSKTDFRQLNIVEYLVVNRGRWTLLKEIGQYIEAPIRTVHSDIQEINHYLFPVSIRPSSRGVQINIPPNYSERYIYKQILGKSREYQLIELLFHDERETLESLSDSLFMSVSTLKRMIKEINNVTSEEGFSIQRKPLSIIGNERKITQFMSFYYTEKYYNQNDYLPCAEKELLDRLIHFVCKPLGKELYYQNKKRVRLWLYINCVRLKNGHNLPYDFTKTISLEVLENKLFCEEFKAAFGVLLSKQTLHQMLYIILNKNFVFKFPELVDVFIDSKEQKIIVKELLLLLKNLETIFDLILEESEKEHLMINLFNLINIKVPKPFILYNKRERFLSELSFNYLFICQVLKDHLIDSPYFHLNEDGLNELTYIILTHWPELSKKLRYMDLATTVNVLVDTDYEHGNLVKNELLNYSRYHIEVFVLDELPKEGGVETSLLITNIPELEWSLSPVVCISEFPTFEDWVSINQKLKEIKGNQQSL